MRAFSEEGVIIDLDRIPMVEIGRAAAHPTRKVRDSAIDQNLSCIPACKRRATDSEIGPRRVRIDRFQALVVVHCFVVASDAEGIRKCRCEDMSFLYRRELPRGQCVELNVIQSVGRGIGRLIVHVGTEQTVLVGKSVIHTTGKKVFVNHLLSGEGEHSKVAIASYEWVLRCRVEGEVRLCGWVHRHVKWTAEIIWVVGIRAQSPGPCDDGGHSRNGRNAL